MTPQDRQAAFRELVSALHPPGNADLQPPELSNWLVTATAPVGQIIDFHQRLRHRLPNARIAYLGNANRINEILSILGTEAADSFSFDDSSLLTQESIRPLIETIRLERFNCRCALMNNSLGIGYAEVFDALLSIDNADFFTCDVNAVFRKWHPIEWIEVKSAQSELNTLLTEAYSTIGY